MEYLDIYDRNGRKTGKTIVRGTPVKPGEYSMSVHLYMYDSNGQFLLQKRSLNKKSLPGIWSVICGAVSSGEDSRRAGVREAAEEVGIYLKEELLQPVSRIRRRHSFIDVYFVQHDFSIEKCVLQEEEVDQVRCATAREVLSVIGTTGRVNSNYYTAVEQAMKKRGLL